MKQTKTTLKELTAAYRAVLRHGILCNAIALGLIAAVPSVATAASGIYVPDTGNWGTQEIKNETNATAWDDTVVWIDKAGVVIGDSSVFEGNKSGVGGAMAIAKQIGEVTIGAGTEFKDNTAVYDGGAIGNYGSAIIGNNVTFSGNKSNINVDGTQLTSDGNPIGGGAISMGVNGSLNLSGATFTNNETGYDGGAISTRRTLQSSEISGFADLGNSLVIGSDSTFTGNKALGYTSDTGRGQKAGGNGGAIANTFATASITDAKFESNTATGKGGAIYNHKFINDNEAGSDTGLGGVMTVTGSEFVKNTADDNGGAIYNEGTMTLDNATFGAVDNTDPEHPVYSNGNTATGNGGAIYNAGTLTVDDSKFYGNSSTSGNGGAIYINASTEDSSKVTTINSSEFAGNRAMNLSGSADSGAITLRYGKLVVDGSTFTDNHAIEGGAIESYKKDNYMEISNSTFKNNEAYAYGAIGVFGFGGTNKIENSHFIGNRSTDSDPAAAAGAVYDGSDGHLVISGTEFTDNNSASSGGAVATRGTVSGGVIKENNSNGYLDIIGSTFENNVGGSNGGAIDNTFYKSSTNAGAVTVQGSTFTSNQANIGGAVYNHGEKDNNGAGVVSAMIIEDSSFTNNTATTTGGAIYNAGTLALAGTNTFTGNNAKNGGAIYNEGTLALNGQSTFADNTATTAGGAIYTTKELLLDGAEFTGNTASLGGAIYTTADLVVEGSTFKNNTGAGTIFNDGGSLVINDSTFDGNELAVSSYGEFGGSSVNGDLTVVESTFKNGTGAIEALNHDAVIIQDGTEFIGNSGAYSVVYLGGNKVVDMRDLTFRNNTMTDLSVIDALNNGDSTDGRADVYIQDVTMEGNSAKSAINIISTADSVARLYNITMDNNAGDGIILGDHVEAELANITITNNKRGDGQGRLFYNGKTANFGGTNTFTDNEAKTFVSAASATTTFSADSTTTFDTGAITGAGTMVVEDGATLNLGTVHVEQGVFTLDGVVNGDLRNADDFLAFNVSNTFDGDGRLNLNLKGVGTYNVFEDKVFNHANVKVTSSSVFDYVWNESYDTITVSTKSANEIAAATGVKTETATTVTSLANSGNETAKQIGQILGEALADGKTDYVEGETKKMAPEDQPVTHSVASTVQNQVLNLAANRMAGPVGRAGGDITSVGYGVWAQGLLNKTKYSGQFNGDSRGFALGFDALINKMYTIGVGYSFSNSDVNVHDGRSIDIDSNTVFLYGQYKPTKWFINATLSNTVSSYSENAVVAGVLLKTDYDVNSFGVQTMTGYDFASGITPSLGLRYLHVSTDGYDTLPGYVGDMNSNYMTAVAGAKYTIPTQKIGDVRWAPEVRAALTYDVISDKNGATVYVPGGTSYHIANDRLSRGGGELGMGLTAEWRGLELSLNYDLQLRKDYLSHTGMIKLRYEF